MRLTLLKVAFIAALVTLAVWQLDFRSFAAALTPRLLLAALLVQPLILFGLLASAARFRELTGPPEISLAASAKAQVLSLGMNTLLPGRMAEILKVTYLRDHAGVAFSAGCAAVVLERLIDVAFLGALAALSLLLLLAEVNPVIMGLAIVAAAGMLALPVLEPLFVRALALLPSRIARELGTAVVQHAARRFREGAVLKAVLYGAAIWTLAGFNVYLFLTVASGGALEPAQALAVFVASLIGIAIPALPGGFGTFEAAVVFVLGRFGFPLEQALAMALVLHAAQIAPVLAGALVIAMRERMGIQSLVRDGARALRAPDRPA
ncbi:MAG: flippase-like domain-containing protein [Burkholderiales bacterium]|nr:flippase-like domain-containing protein [Burkholderiales bacterium]